MNLKEYLSIVCEIDFIYFQLEQMAKEEAKLPPIYRMIDEATGFDREKMKIAKKLNGRAKKLMEKLKEGGYIE
jgi:hypothetical protein